MEPQDSQADGGQSEDISRVEVNEPSEPSVTPPEDPVASAEPSPAAVYPQSVPAVIEPAPVQPEAQPAATTTDLTVTGVHPVASGVSPQPGVVVSGGSSAPVTPEPSGRKCRWLLPVIIVVAVLLLLAGGYAFAIYLPNRPNVVYATSLSRTGDAVDALVQYSQGISKKGYKSFAVTGTLHSKGSASYDGSLSGSADGRGNASFKLGADIMGEKMNANIESVHVDGSAMPDYYVQLTGVKRMLDGVGLNSLDSLDGKWVVIDHTVLDSIATNLSKQSSGITKSSMDPTEAELNDAVDKVQAVNKQYIFTTDKSKAVLANEKYIGKVTQDGRETYHYTVGYNRAHLKAYIGAVGSALNSSSLNTWAKTATHNGGLSQMLALQSLETSVSHANAGYTFDVWVDAKTKLVHTVTFADPKQAGSTFSLSQNYTGGSTYPFALHFNDTTSGQAEHGSLDVVLDTKNDSFKGELTDVANGGTDVTANFTVTPSKKDVQVTPPSGAEPIASLLSQWGLNGASF